MKQRDYAEKLLMYYYFWGIAATLSFLVFGVVLAFALIAEDIGIATIFFLLLSGFLWIGTTVVSRHAFIIIKQYIGKEVSTKEFLSTQLIVVFFPLVYASVKREVEEFRRNRMKDV